MAKKPKMVVPLTQRPKAKKGLIEKVAKLALYHRQSWQPTTPR
jgi:hypothetical protein